MCCAIRYIDSTEAVRVVTLCFTMSSSHVTGSYKVVNALKYIRKSKPDWETSLQQSFEGGPLNLEDNVEVETHPEANHAKVWKMVDTHIEHKERQNKTLWMKRPGRDNFETLGCESCDPDDMPT